MKKSRLFWTLIFFCIFLNVPQVSGLLNQCGIQFCSSCDPKTNFCNQCQLPYKPGYANQSICTRCSNNCAVCQKQGTDSKGRCLSCQPNYDYTQDEYCNTFQIWVSVVTIACYVIFIIVLFLAFCYMKRRKQKTQSFWFQTLKFSLNKVDNDRITVLEFEKMCEYLVDLLKESSSYNNLKFRDRQFQKAMKLQKVELKLIKTETHMKKIKMRGFDNSQWQGRGYVFIPKDSSSKLKLWFVKNYTRKVFSENISKIIIYESESIQTNEIKGKWYYHESPEIGGDWKGLRQQFANNVEMVNMQQ